jgi:hypothetical protein
MADNDGGGGSGWLGFLAGALVVALIGAAIYLYAGAGRSQQQAQLELSVPNVKLNPPDVHLPSPPPAPAVPPQTNQSDNSNTAPPAPPPS